MLVGLLFSLFQDIGFNHKETQNLFHKNPSLNFTTTSLESLTTRLLSLRSLGLLSLCHSINKQPEILTAEEIGSFLSFIKEYDLEGEIKPQKLQRLLIMTHPNYFAGFERKVRLLIDHGVPLDKLAHVLNNVNIAKVFCHRTLNQIERAILFLDRFGGAELIVRRPALLNLDLEGQLKPRIGVLTQLSGGDENAVGTILRKLPAILTYTVEHLQNHIELLRSFAGLSDEEIFKIFLVYPNICSASKERKLHPRIEFLKQCGFNSSDIFKFLIKAPLYLSLSFEDNLSMKLGILFKIGYENKSKELAIALGAVTRTSCENMQKVTGVFLSYGFCCEDILDMSKRHPQILQYNHESLDMKIEYLTVDMGRHIGELLAFPAFLGYKLDDRIKHRYEMKKKIVGDGMSLNKLLSVSTERFMKKKSPAEMENSVGGRKS
ncbi:hypothetical protein GIB67_033346 [Kingdonia uniflora]|uniref:Uncharacterized protein n=1 Tax=Kingdonia uniflora TaxID=39325 RepID=A0A7J7LTT5_9MAGN|nr:hypothetical protein GIB67_033346 [Kingdonia uniflora]